MKLYYRVLNYILVKNAKKVMSLVPVNSDFEFFETLGALIIILQ